MSLKKILLLLKYFTRRKRLCSCANKFVVSIVDMFKGLVAIGCISVMCFFWEYTRRDSNSHRRNRNPIFYPLNYGCRNYLKEILFQFSVIVSLFINGLTSASCSSERYPSRSSFSVNAFEPFSNSAETG